MHTMDTIPSLDPPAYEDRATTYPGICEDCGEVVEFTEIGLHPYHYQCNRCGQSKRDVILLEDDAAEAVEDVVWQANRSVELAKAANVALTEAYEKQVAALNARVEELQAKNRTIAENNRVWRRRAQEAV